MLQEFILDRIIKITPSHNQLRWVELFKYDNYWHRFKKKITDKQDMTLCGEVFLTVQRPDFAGGDLEELRDLLICPDCLKIWYENSEKEFEKNHILRDYSLYLKEENAEFVKMLIENEGYNKFEELLNSLLSNYLKEHQLLEKLRYKLSQRQN
jgi:hypothetical protein